MSYPMRECLEGEMSTGDRGEKEFPGGICPGGEMSYNRNEHATYICTPRTTSKLRRAYSITDLQHQYKAEITIMVTA